MNEKKVLRAMIYVLALWQLLLCAEVAHSRYLLRETRHQLDCANQQAEKAIGIMEKMRREGFMKWPEGVIKMPSGGFIIDGSASHAR